MSIAQVNTLSDLRNLSGMTANEVRFMKGRDAVGDPGAGIYEWMPVLDEDNDSTVIMPSGWSSSSSGRWIRQLDVRGPVHAEWFGALGNGTADDRQAIQDCLDTFGRVTLLAKDYCIEAALELEAGYVVEGQGMGLTTVKFADHTTQEDQLAAFTGAAAHNAVIRQLTIDCGGGTGSQNNSAYQAIDLQGGNILIERVEAKNFRATRSGTRDCVVIGIENDGNTTRMGVIRDCVVQSPAANDNSLSTTITCLSLMGQTAPSGSYPGQGGAVMRNRILGLKHVTSPSATKYTSQLRAIVFGRSIGVEVAENEIVGFDGAAISSVSTDASEHDSVIRGNRLLNVQAGIVIGTGSGTAEHLRGRVFDNLITFALVDVYSAVGTYGLVGIRFVDAGTQVAGDCWIQRNVIQGSTQGTTVPIGIDLQRESSAGEPVVVEDNVIETPDQPSSGGLGVDYENAVVLTPYDGSSGSLDLKKVEVHGNRNLGGVDLRMKVQGTGHPYWGPHSTRLARFMAPAYDGRVGLVSEEFLGEAPAFALGWTSSTVGDASVDAVSGEAGHPGIVSLLVQTSSSSSSAEAWLKYGTDGILLGTSLRQVLAFGAKRTVDATSAQNYTVLMGFLRTSDNQGVYFSIHYGSVSDDNKIFGWARNATSSSSIAQVTLEDKGSDRDWRDYRIEITLTDDAPPALEARFFVNDIFIGSLPASCIPDDVTLLAGFKVVWSYGGDTKGLLVDYFQHQVTPV